MTKIAYLAHPVSKEKKAEARKEGFKIIDRRFAPAEIGEDDVLETVATDEQTDPITRESIADMKKADVVDLLEMHGASTEGNLPELRERLIATVFVDA